MRAALISMPFAPLFAPSIALGLLKSMATARGWDIDVHYFNLSYAKRMGEDLYEHIAQGEIPTELLAGEWIFREGLGANASRMKESEYLAMLRPALAGHRTHHMGVDEAIARMLSARAMVGGWIEECALAVASSEPCLVGFTSTFQQNAASWSLASRLRRLLPRAFIVFGGANCEGPMGRTLLEHASCIDAVVSGEGEAAFQAIMECLEAGRRPVSMGALHVRQETLRIPIAGSFKSQATAHMDGLPTPDYSDFFDQVRAAGIREPSLGFHIPFETSRGCWWGEKHHCTFCGLNGETMKFRSKSGERALAELRELVSAYGIRRIAVSDNIIDMKYFRDFLPRLAQAGLGVSLFYEVKANLSMEHLTLLKAAGVNRIQPGIESFSDDVLKRMRKGVRGIHNVQLLRECAVAKVHPTWNIIWGFPGESLPDYHRMSAMIPSLQHLTPPECFGPVRLDRFSPLFEDREGLGVKDVRPCPGYAHVYGLSDAALFAIACYFESATPDRSADPAVPLLTQRLREWQDVHAESELVYADTGTHLRIWDTRRCAVEALTELDGAERAMFLHFTQSRSVASAEAIASRESLSAFVRRMTARRLLVESDDWALTLALPLGCYQPKPAGRAALRKAIERSGLQAVQPVTA